MALCLKGSFDGRDSVEALLQICIVDDGVTYDVTKLRNSKFMVEFNKNIGKNLSLFFMLTYNICF